MWRVCGRIGKFYDVFISKKKSRLGKRFGLVRFPGDYKYEYMINLLHKVWFGYDKLFASFPIVPKTAPLQHSWRAPSKTERLVSPVNSYASVLRGSPTMNYDKAYADEILYLPLWGFYCREEETCMFCQS